MRSLQLNLDQIMEFGQPHFRYSEQAVSFSTHLWTDEEANKFLQCNDTISAVDQWSQVYFNFISKEINLDIMHLLDQVAKAFKGTLSDAEFTAALNWLFGSKAMINSAWARSVLLYCAGQPSSLK